MTLHSLRQIGLLLGLGGAGAALGMAAGLPVPLLTGPAILTTLASLAGLRLVFPKRLRDGVFLLAGLAIGATVSQESVQALATWPLAFAILGAAILAMILIGQRMMQRMMGIDRRSGLLASAPGHLSFVIALGEDLGLKTDRIAIVQSIRVLALTLIVPVAARLGGFETGLGLAPAGETIAEMTLLQTGIVAVAALALAPVLRWIGAPAPVLLAGMALGAGARLGGFVPGGVNHWIAYLALASIGTLIGTRFSGVGLRDLRQAALAGIAGTVLATALAAVAAVLAAPIVDMPLMHVLVAFAPGGLETMAAIGVAIGANTGFVAAAHVGRLVLLSVLVPALLGYNRKRDERDHPQQ